MRADIVPGRAFPDYELTDHGHARRRLTQLQGNDPMILLLAHGHFCPKDHQQHLELAAFYPKISVAYTQIVTISTDNIIETREFRASVALSGRSSPTPAGRCRRTSTSRSTPTPITIHDPPHTRAQAWTRDP